MQIIRLSQRYTTLNDNLLLQEYAFVVAQYIVSRTFRK